jgi:PAS domain S-box-containing protein/putative nucleotidyltransferase with HDIG domain
VIATDLDGIVTSWNQGAERMLGYTEAEALGRHIAFVYPEEEQAFLAEQVIAPLLAKGNHEAEIRIQKKSGEIFFATASLSLLRDEHGNAVGMIGYSHDISEHKHAQSRLNEVNEKLGLSLNLLKGIIESIPIRVFWKDRELNYLGCNSLFANDAGLTDPEALIGKSDFDMGWQEQAELYRDDDERVMLSGIPKLGYEEPQTTAEGDTIWLRTSKVPLLNTSREVIGVLGIYDDITRQKQAEEDILRNQGRLKEAQMVAHLGSWELDLVKNDLWWSDENYCIFGVEPGGGNTYETFLETVHPDDRDFVNKTYQDSVKNKTAYSIDHRLLLKDGTVKWVNERCKTYYADDGTPLRSAGTTLDITQQHNTQEDLNRSNRALRAISSCNSVLVHATHEDELFHNMCRVIIDDGGYRFAWIGVVEEDDSKRVRPVAHAGFEDGYLEQVNFTYDDSEHGRGPAGCAVRHGEPQVVNDIHTDANFTPWRQAADERGFHSVLALPLKHNNNQVFAILSIYAEESDAFDTEALGLLQELASDLAFGILALRTRDERDHYLQEHQKSDERYQQVLVDTIRAISLTVEKRDPYTAGHQNKVAQLSVAIGRELGMDDNRLEGLRLGAMIHDIGKIYVPAEILNRPGRLSSAEFEIIKSHSEVGFDIIKDVHFPWPVAEMVIQHHERMDGSGYPRGLQGEEIILEARILAVADVVEAITSHRPYRPAVGLDKALLEIEDSRGIRYDTDVANACLSLIRDKHFAFEEENRS